MSSPTSASVVTGRSVTPSGRRDVRGHVADLRDHHGLLLVGHEPGRRQPAAQVRRLVVVVELPLERQPEPGEVPDLRGDHPVGRVRAGQAGPGNAGPAAAVRGDPPDDGAGPLGVRSRRVGAGAAADLLIEHGAQCGVIHPRRSPSRAGPRNWFHPAGATFRRSRRAADEDAVLRPGRVQHRHMAPAVASICRALSVTPHGAEPAPPPSRPTGGAASGTRREPRPWHPVIPDRLGWAGTRRRAGPGRVRLGRCRWMGAAGRAAATVGVAAGDAAAGGRRSAWLTPRRDRSVPRTT